MDFTNDRRYAKAVAEYEVAETLKNLSDTNDIAESLYSSLIGTVETRIEELTSFYGVYRYEVLNAIEKDSFNF